MRAALLFAAAAEVALAAYPKFADSWSAFVISDLLQDQGAYTLPNGDYCCSSEAVQCQVQVQSSGGMLYWDLPHNRSTNIYGAAYQPYGIVDDFNSGMEMAIDENFVCQSYCPIQGPMEPYNVDGTTDAGKATLNINGANIQVEVYTDTDIIPVLNITMETDYYYINQTDFNNAIPIIEVDDLTPMGENIGQSNTTFANFKPGPQDAKWFNVTGVSQCPMSNQCNSNSVRQLHRLAVHRKADFYRAYFAAKAEKAAAEQKAMEKASAAVNFALSKKN